MAGQAHGLEAMFSDSQADLLTLASVSRDGDRYEVVSHHSVPRPGNAIAAGTSSSLSPTMAFCFGTGALCNMLVIDVHEVVAALERLVILVTLKMCMPAGCVTQSEQLLKCVNSFVGLLTESCPHQLS